VDAGRSFERSELQLDLETSVSEQADSSGMSATMSGISLSQFMMVIRGMMGGGLANCSVTRLWAACGSLEDTEAVEIESGRQLIGPVSAGVDVTSRRKTGRSACFQFTIACKEMTLILGIWPLSRPTILAELRLLEVVFVAAELISVGETLSFEAFDCVDCRAASPSAGTFRVKSTSCCGYAVVSSSA
jgi:hypothetical protein